MIKLSVTSLDPRFTNSWSMPGEMDQFRFFQRSPIAVRARDESQPEFKSIRFKSARSEVLVSFIIKLVLAVIALAIGAFLILGGIGLVGGLIQIVEGPVYAFVWPRVVAMGTAMDPLQMQTFQDPIERGSLMIAWTILVAAFLHSILTSLKKG